jgi:hypothetical protein
MLVCTLGNIKCCLILRKLRNQFASLSAGVYHQFSIEEIEAGMSPVQCLLLTYPVHNMNLQNVFSISHV